jgi:hypothetical protein
MSDSYTAITTGRAINNTASYTCWAVELKSDHSIRRPHGFQVRRHSGIAGLAARPSQSGLSKGRDAIGGGRPCVRAAFYMAALVGARTNLKFKQLYKNTRDAGKPAKVALVAIARRIVALANALIRDNRTFDQSHFVS